jgi:pseudouridine-5'-monophosphatase
MDGLLINSEDMVTQSTNSLLAKNGRPPLTSSIRVQMMGIPGSNHSDLFHDWARLPISREQFAHEIKEEMQRCFQHCKPLPGAEELLSNLSRARNALRDKIELALATSSTSASYKLKTSNQLETKQMMSYFQPDWRRVLGDDPRVRQGRGKPAPDIYLAALQSLNSALIPAEKPIMPSECLVFEDSVVGVEAGRRAGMRVIWVPHPDLEAEYQPVQKAVLAGRAGMREAADEWQLGEVDDGWAESISSLEDFDYEKYGILVPS